MVKQVNIVDLATHLAEIDLDLELMKRVEEKRQFINDELINKQVVDEEYRKKLHTTLDNFDVELELNLIKFKDINEEASEYSETAQELFNDLYDFYFNAALECVVTEKSDT